MVRKPASQRSVDSPCSATITGGANPRRVHSASRPSSPLGRRRLARAARRSPWYRSVAGSASTILGSRNAEMPVTVKAAAVIHRPNGYEPVALIATPTHGAAQHGGDQPEHRQPGIGLDQRQVGRHQPRRGRGPDHRVGLGQHQRPERGREQHQQVGEVPGHHDRQHRPSQRGGGHHPPPAVLHPVQRGPDHRRDDRERGHRHQQVEQHVAALGLRRRGEEHRAGQRDGHHRVGRVGHHLVPDERRQAGLAGAVGLAGRDHLVGEQPGEVAAADQHGAGDRDVAGADRPHRHPRRPPRLQVRLYGHPGGAGGRRWRRPRNLRHRNRRHRNRPERNSRRQPPDRP